MVKGPENQIHFKIYEIEYQYVAMWIVKVLRTVW